MTEKEHFWIRLIAAVLALVLITGWIPPMEVSAATQGLTLDELMAKFPDGKYWNGGDADSWTETPCTHHGSCGGYSGSCGCNSFLGVSIQCMGFAEKLGYDATGFNPRLNADGWYTYESTSALNSLKPGDIVRIDSASGYGHSIYITAVDGDQVTYGDCNSINRSCNIRWGATTTKTYLKSVFQYVRSAPTELVTGYLGQCEDHLSSGTVAAQTDTVLMTYPCGTEIYEKSLEAAAVPAGTELTVTGVYRNTEGAYWYEVTWQEQTCYFPASDAGEFVCDWGSVTVTGVTAPKHTRQGRSFALYGTVSSDALPLSQVGAYIFQGTAVSETPYMTSEDTAVSGYTYTVRSSTVDNNLTFGKLPAGEFTYLLSAAVTNSYISDGSLVSEQRIVRLHQNTFTVSATSISCSHSYSETVTAEATCGDDGILTFTCTKCGFSYTQTTFASGAHSLGDWEVAQEPTCTEDGYKLLSCQSCSLAYIQTISAAGHSIVTDEAVPATCTAAGLTAGSHCTLCGEVITAQETVPASGHNEQATYVAPTCTEQGYTVYTCTDCGDSYIEDYEEALGHSYEAVVTPPTASEQGYTTYTCTACGDSYADSYTDPAAPETPEASETPSVNLRFSGASLVLEADLTLNFTVRQAVLEQYSDIRVEYTMNGETTVVSEGVASGTGKAYPFQGIAPRMMKDDICVTIYGTFDGVEYTYSMNYSAAQYCYNQLGTDALKTLLVDLLNYGTAHQVYLDYNTENRINAELTAEQAAWGTAADPALESMTSGKYIAHEAPTASFKAPALKLTNAVEVVFALNCASLTDMTGVALKIEVDDGENGIITYTVDAPDFAYDASAGTYKVYFKNLLARQLRCPIYATVLQNGEAISHTMRYSVESYAYSTHNSTVAGLADLVKAMIRYGDAAYDYINS